MTMNRKQRRAADRSGQVPRGDLARRELLKLRFEIDEDVKAGRLEQWEYELAKERIEAELRKLDEPLPPGEKIRVVAIPRKQIDYEKLAQVVWMQAEQIAREKQGLPPPTDEQQKRSQALWIQAAAEARRAKVAEAEGERKKAEVARRRFVHAKPAQIRQATWDWLIDQGLTELPEDGRLGPLLVGFGGLSRAELLHSTVVQLGDGVDCIIDRAAAEAIAAQSPSVMLVLLVDRNRVEIPLSEVIRAISDGRVFDQLDL